MIVVCNVSFFCNTVIHTGLLSTSTASQMYCHWACFDVMCQWAQHSWTVVQLLLTTDAKCHYNVVTKCWHTGHKLILICSCILKSSKSPDCWSENYWNWFEIKITLTENDFKPFDFEPYPTLMVILVDCIDCVRHTVQMRCRLRLKIISHHSLHSFQQTLITASTFTYLFLAACPSLVVFHVRFHCFLVAFFTRIYLNLTDRFLNRWVWWNPSVSRSTSTCGYG